MSRICIPKEARRMKKEQNTMLAKNSSIDEKRKKDPLGREYQTGNARADITEKALRIDAIDDNMQKAVSL